MTLLVSRDFNSYWMSDMTGKHMVKAPLVSCIAFALIMETVLAGRLRHYYLSVRSGDMLIHEVQLTHLVGTFPAIGYC